LEFQSFGLKGPALIPPGNLAGRGLNLVFPAFRCYIAIMRRRMAIIVVMGLLFLYAGAGLHQVLHHHTGHDAGKGCPLCVLLTTPLLPAAASAVQTVMPVAPAPNWAYEPVAAPAPRGPLCLRGPPLS